MREVVELQVSTLICNFAQLRKEAYACAFPNYETRKSTDMRLPASSLATDVPLVPLRTAGLSLMRVAL